MHTLGKWSHKSEVVGQGLFLLVIFFLEWKWKWTTRANVFSDVIFKMEVFLSRSKDCCRILEWNI